MLTGSSPIFATQDVEATIAFYRDILGFTSSWTWGEPVSFGGATLGEVTIMFALQPELSAQVRAHQHWLNVEYIDKLYAEHVERGATIISQIEDKPWGVREYVLEDVNGYHLRFAGNQAAPSQPSSEMPAGVRIARRKPTAPEYAHVSDHQKPGDEDIFDQSWNGVVALSPGGEVIGTTRIVRDSEGWFSIWDVAVKPEWQGRRIGHALMSEALATIRESSPDAWVHLFTTKHGFYERLGFKSESVMMRRV